MSLISETEAWRTLNHLQSQMRGVSLHDLFRTAPERSVSYALAVDDLYIDFSRQRLNDDVLTALLQLAETADVQGFLQRMVRGDVINSSEGRAVLHTQSRGTASGHPALAKETADADQRLQSFTDAVHIGKIRSATGQPFRHVVAIGIGGSELGPALALDALRDGVTRKLDVRVLGNIDGIAFKRAFDGLDPSDTLVVVISKSFTTPETATNADLARLWMQHGIGDKWADNFAVVSANIAAASKFGVTAERVFPMWDRVGGRYSLWSAVGLPVALAFGWSVFCEIRDGARAMDKHVLEAPLRENAAAILALLMVWNASFLGYAAEACVPYDTRLALLVDHLQQLEMESNGKRVTLAGEAVDFATQPVVFGGVGVNVQHAFFQQLHQGTTSAPLDILLPATAPTGDSAVHEQLVAAALAQVDALAFGRENLDEPHRHYPGNRPSTLIVYKDLRPAVFGKLVALYEHKTAIAGAVWGINSFDQWGVELGKVLSREIAPMLADPTTATSSLAPVIGAIRRMQKP